VFLAAWDQFQAYRTYCNDQNAKAGPSGARLDPIWDFTGFDLDQIRKDTHALLTSERQLNPCEIKEALEHLGTTQPPLIAQRSTHWCFGGQADNGEQLGIHLNSLREYLENSANSRWWYTLVLIASLLDGAARSLSEMSSRTGLPLEVIDRGIRMIRMGFRVADKSGNVKLFRGRLVETAVDKFRLPDSLLFAGSDDVEVADLTPAPVPPVPSPITVAPPATANVDDILQELKKVGGDKVNGTKPVPSLSVIPMPPTTPLTTIVVPKSDVPCIMVPVSQAVYDLLTDHLKAEGKTPESFMREVVNELVDAITQDKRNALQLKIAELEAERNRLLAEQSRLLAAGAVLA